MKGFGMTATAATQKLETNDPSLTICDLSNNAVLQMKAPELMPKLAAALAVNTTCLELNLSNCNLTDPVVAFLATALEKNTTLVSLNLEGNKVGNDGMTSLANSLAKNRGLMQLNLLGQKGTRFGDACLHAVTTMFDTNITLIRIVWRLESRQSFRINKLIVRNNDINKRIRDGKDYADILPQGVAPMSEALIAQRADAAYLIHGSGDSVRQSRTDSTDDESGRISARLSARGSGEAAGAATCFPRVVSSGSSAQPPAAPKPAAPPPLAAPDAQLEAAMTKLELEYEEELAALKAKYADKKAKLIESHAASGNGAAAEVS